MYLNVSITSFNPNAWWVGSRLVCLPASTSAPAGHHGLRSAVDREIVSIDLPPFAVPVIQQESWDPCRCNSSLNAPLPKTKRPDTLLVDALK